MYPAAAGGEQRAKNHAFSSREGRGRMPDLSQKSGALKSLADAAHGREQGRQQFPVFAFAGAPAP